MDQNNLALNPTEKNIPSGGNAPHFCMISYYLSYSGEYAHDFIETSGYIVQTKPAKTATTQTSLFFSWRISVGAPRMKL